jgi:hypothetical protein
MCTCDSRKASCGVKPIYAVPGRAEITTGETARQRQCCGIDPNAGTGRAHITGT